MKVIYIAGPYTGTDVYDTHMNIQEAEYYAAAVWEHGGAALCPHKNTAYMDGITSYDKFLEGCIEMMRRCDAVWLMLNWEESKGAVREMEVAKAENLKVLKNQYEVVQFLAEGE